MKREQILHEFSRRLVALMQQAGLHSSRSKAAVKVNKLAEISDCSLQMARRYVLAEALPDIYTIYKIAKWLDVSAGWLLFGEETVIPNNIEENQLIRIDKDLLEYIIMKNAALFGITKDTRELVSFIMDIINDATHIEANRKTILKMIDISVSSALRFHGIKNDKKIQTA